MAARARSYRTVFFGQLVQRSAFSSGGNDPDQRTDNPLCRDGLGRYLLRGTGLAGALAATARKVYGAELPKEICRHPSFDPARDDVPYPSCWLTHHAHLSSTLDKQSSEFRQGVAIRQQTGARAGRALYDVEVLPEGTCWNFFLEVESARDTQDELGLRLAALALFEWREGRCLLGRSVARGLGWMQLRQCRVLTLKIEDLLCWPNALRGNDAADWSEWEQLQRLTAQRPRLVRSLDVAYLNDLGAGPQDTQPWHYRQCEICIEVGADADGYGLDGLSVGGHALDILTSGWDSEHYLAPGKYDDPLSAQQAMRDVYQPDHQLAMYRNADGDSVPFIPGSSIRGVLRHALSRQLRLQELTIRDPSLTREKPEDKQDAIDKQDDVENLFGSTLKSAALLIRDGYLVDGCAWRAAWLQQHAEDEFTGGVYRSAKFDRMALIQGLFRCALLLEGPDESKLAEQQNLLDQVLERGRLGHLPLGGNQWRGLGWVRWQAEPWQTGTYGIIESADREHDKTVV